MEALSLDLEDPQDSLQVFVRKRTHAPLLVEDDEMMEDEFCPPKRSRKEPTEIYWQFPLLYRWKTNQLLKTLTQEDSTVAEAMLFYSSQYVDGIPYPFLFRLLVLDLLGVETGGPIHPLLEFPHVDTLFPNHSPMPQITRSLSRIIHRLRGNTSHTRRKGTQEIVDAASVLQSQGFNSVLDFLSTIWSKKFSLESELCPKCRSSRLEVQLRQVRSGDEPMNIFYKCNRCKHEWKK